MPQVKCKGCGKLMSLTDEEMEWKTLCLDCYKGGRTAKPKPAQAVPDQASESAIDKAYAVAADKEIAVLADIATRLARKLGKLPGTLDPEEKPWVTTIYIQLRR